MTVATALDDKVLVLNRFYAAIRIIGARRAFRLLVGDRAEVIDVADGMYNNYDFATWTEVSVMQKEFEPDRHAWISTPRVEIAVPKIIRLLGYDRLPRQHVKLTRRNIFARDRNRCQYCGKNFSTSDLSLDHVVPRVQGGGDTWDNIVCACVKCNARKGGRTPHQAGMSLVRAPAQPRRNPTITIKLGDEKYSSWKAFLNDAYWHVELG